MTRSANPIEIWTHRPRIDRADLIVEMMDDICPETQEDFLWAKQHLGMEARECIDLFIKAEKLALLRAPDGQPLYLFAFSPYLSTFSTSRRRGLGLYLTKEILRWSRTQAGQDFFDGTWALADVADIGKSFHAAWITKMGYTFYDAHTLPSGPVINRYRFERV